MSTAFSVGARPIPTPEVEEERKPAKRKGVSRVVVPVGRLAFVAIFLLSALGHFSRASIGYAAEHGVPLAEILVPAAGALALLGGLSILLGYRARLGAWLLVAFLVPVTVLMHNFWAIEDPATAGLQRVMFLKNLSMLGGALLLTHFGAGPVSLDARRKARVA
jgi:putative oxidoreductase